MTEQELIKAQQDLIAAQQSFMELLIGKGNLSTAQAREDPEPEGERSGGTPEPEKPETMTFRQCAEYYMKNHKNGMRPSSYASNRFKLDKWILPELGDTSVSGLKNRRIQAFADKLLEKFTQKTARDAVALVRTVLNYCAADEIIEPVTFKVRWPKMEKEESRVLTKEEVDKICQNAKERGKPSCIGILLAAKTGMRIGEVCGLKWGDVDTEKNEIHVRRTVQRILDGNGSSYRYEGPPKSRAGNRTIPITDGLGDYLEGARKEAGVYVASGRETPTEPRTLRQSYKRFLDSIGVEYINPHGLRHTFATRAVESGMDPKTLAKILGHENCNITLDIYTSATSGMMRKGMEKLDDFCGPEKEGAP